MLPHSGQLRAAFGKARGQNVTSVGPNAQSSGTKLGQFRSSVADIGHHVIQSNRRSSSSTMLPSSARSGPNTGLDLDHFMKTSYTQPDLTKLGPNSVKSTAEFGPSSTELGKTWPGVNRIWVDVGESWREARPIWAMFDSCRSHLVRIVPHVGQCWAKSTPHEQWAMFN